MRPAVARPAHAGDIASVDDGRAVDLHVHSTASDGVLPPRALVEAACARGLAALAISDHDTVGGIREAAAASGGTGLVFIPAVELSINLLSGGSAHLLGYFPGTAPELLDDPLTPLGRSLQRVRDARGMRNPRIIEKLAQLGLPLFEEEVLEHAGGDVVGRPHIAQAMVSRGYVQNSREAFDRFLGRGRPAYVERDRLWENESIDLIRGMGGLPVLAHPGLLERDRTGLGALLGAMTGRGLAGVEAYYPRHSAEMTAHLSAVARDLGLFLTGGTDFHGAQDDPAVLGGTPGVFEVTAGSVGDFLSRCEACTLGATAGQPPWEA